MEKIMIVLQPLNIFVKTLKTRLLSDINIGKWKSIIYLIACHLKHLKTLEIKVCYFLGSN